MKHFVYALIGSVTVVTVASARAQDQTLTATVTIKTSGYTTAVHGKSSDPKQGDFLFCIDQERSGAAQAVNFAGPARVFYRAVPITGVPAGVTINGPENVASVLTVIAENGSNWTFVGKGEKPLLPTGGPALVKPSTVNVSIVRRTDWAAASGPRRGTDVASCLAAAG